MKKKLFVIKIAACLASLIAINSSLAQSWPSKPVRIVVPLTGGSNADILARTLAGKLQQQFNQTFLVENRAGGNGVIGVNHVAKAEPDGYTLLVHTSSYTVTPVTSNDLPYDTIRDFSGITPLGVAPLAMIISPSKGHKTIHDLVRHAKSRPGSINYASAGAAGQLNSERFRISAGFEGVHIPYKGTPEAVTDVLTGRVDYYFCPITPVLSYIREGKLLALAVGSSTRSSVLPDVPTTLEAGFPNSEYNFWTGLFAPSKTPRAVINRLYEETIKALDTPEIRERLAKLGTEPMRLTPEQFDKRIRDELAVNAIAAKAAGMSAQ